MGNGMIRMIYCQMDGGCRWAGKTLLEHYDTPEKVAKLFGERFGDLSRLAPEVGEKHDFDNPPDGVCNFYGRDRGEPWTGDNVFGCFSDWLEAPDRPEYNYILTPHGWMVLIHRRSERTKDRESMNYVIYKPLSFAVEQSL